MMLGLVGLPFHVTLTPTCAGDARCTRTHPTTTAGERGAYCIQCDGVPSTGAGGEACDDLLPPAGRFSRVLWCGSTSTHW